MFTGRWRDPGVQMLPNVTTLRGVEEPPYHRVPLQFWDEARGLSHDVRHYPIYEEFYNSTTLDPGVYTPTYNLTLLPFTPAYVPRRDRMGLLYGDARIFDTWPSWTEEFTLRVEEATNVTIIPETGHLYQKLYIGPVPVTTGWTMGSLIKAFAAQRCPGHAIVALKLHAPRKPNAGGRRGRKKTGEGEPQSAGGEAEAPMVTQLPNVREDLLEIALNLKGVAFETLRPRESACVRVKAVGPQLLVAGMIDWPSFVRVGNPEHFIAKVEEGGVLDLEMKLEWGRGAWLADLHGLYREEEGVDTRCYKRRRIWEVDHRGFYPTSCIFGACTMMRLAVHKLMGTRFCQE
ncbi:DNA-directed RNA polymerase, alpha subunit [Toxoplasma gondii CAST]|uniref:DNA-directed RNA polymerase, alpha subunit n=2 Tax=Toxoplasma gondii TaxID=5811 RepID=A0A3R7YTD5_TOXGO|nr:DNA-directed RNA polymerase, alpha subunit [Toxoplasma gondii CAST]